jgi:hypothetical protein
MLRPPKRPLIPESTGSDDEAKIGLLHYIVKQFRVNGINQDHGLR